MRTILLTLFTILFTDLSFSQILITSDDWDRKELHGQVRPINRKIYTIEEISVDALIKDQVAEVSVTQTIKNPNDYAMEVQVLFPLPHDGVIQNFILMVDGEELTGEIMAKDKARSIYEGIVRRQRDPALMEYMGHGLFKTSIFPVGVGQTRKINIRYTQINKMKLGSTQFQYPIGTLKFSSRPIPKVKVITRLKSSSDLKSVYSPNPGVKINKINERSTTIVYEASNVIPLCYFK